MVASFATTAEALICIEKLRLQRRKGEVCCFLQKYPGGVWGVGEDKHYLGGEIFNCHVCYRKYY